MYGILTVLWGVLVELSDKHAFKYWSPAASLWQFLKVCESPAFQVYPVSRVAPRKRSSSVPGPSHESPTCLNYYENKVSQVAFYIDNLNSLTWDCQFDQTGFELHTFLTEGQHFLQPSVHEGNRGRLSNFGPCVILPWWIPSSIHRSFAPFNTSKGILTDPDTSIILQSVGLATMKEDSQLETQRLVWI